VGGTAEGGPGQEAGAFAEAARIVIDFAALLKAELGLDVPAIALGTYNLRGASGVDSMVSGIEAGYRMLDSAFNYENEGALGAAGRRCASVWTGARSMHAQAPAMSQFPACTRAAVADRPEARSARSSASLSSWTRASMRSSPRIGRGGGAGREKEKAAVANKAPGRGYVCAYQYFRR